MANRKYNNIGIVEAPFLTAASSGFTILSDSNVGDLVALSADETAAIATAATAIRPILGQMTQFEDDSNVTIKTNGFTEVLCGETITVGSAVSGLYGTASGVLFSVTASYAAAKGDNYGNVQLIKGGTTTSKAIIKLL